MSEVAGMSAEKLKSFLDRVMRLEDEISNIRGDIKEVWAEAKSSGFDVKIMRKVLALAKMDSDERSELDHLMDTYRAALDI